MKLFAASILMAACLSQAMAEPGVIKLTTNKIKYAKWTVYEISNGSVIPGVPVFAGKIFWGKSPGFTIPFTDCDGYWYAKRTFRLPRDVTNAKLRINRISADDRVVLELNGNVIASAGTDNNGDGFMQFRDPGKNRNHHFEYQSGRVNVTDTTHLKPGLNTLTAIVNNTGEGIYGTIIPVTPNSPSDFGLEGEVTYTP